MEDQVSKQPARVDKHSPSIVDVAERAGVSLATASRVMSNAVYPVSPTTRQKVLDAAHKLGYTPNSLARSLRSRRSKLLAVLVGDNVDPYFAEITRGVEEIANEQGYLTIICNTERDAARELHYLRTLREYRADGLIFAGGGLNDPGHVRQVEAILTDMSERGSIAITLSPHFLHIPTIQVDNFGGSQAMTTKLIELGHRRIAFVTGPAHLTTANLRLQGYMAALLQRNLTVDPDFLLTGNFDQASGEHAARTVARFSPEARPTAIFAANDETAFGVIAGLREQGLRVPEDLSVCGFGDVPTARLVTPTLTTVHIPLRRLGQLGVSRLLAALNQEEIPQTETLPVTVIERASTRVLQSG